MGSTHVEWLNAQVIIWLALLIILRLNLLRLSESEIEMEMKASGEVVPTLQCVLHHLDQIMESEIELEIVQFNSIIKDKK